MKFEGRNNTYSGTFKDASGPNAKYYDHGSIQYEYPAGAERNSHGSGSSGSAQGTRTIIGRQNSAPSPAGFGQQYRIFAQYQADSDVQDLARRLKDAQIFLETDKHGFTREPPSDAPGSVPKIPRSDSATQWPPPLRAEAADLQPAEGNHLLPEHEASGPHQRVDGDSGARAENILAGQRKDSLPLYQEDDPTPPIQQPPATAHPTSANEKHSSMSPAQARTLIKQAELLLQEHGDYVAAFGPQSAEREELMAEIEYTLAQIRERTARPSSAPLSAPAGLPDQQGASEPVVPTFKSNNPFRPR